MREFGEAIDPPSPVMTLEVAGTWLAVPVEQMDRIAFAERLWPVPLSWPQHLGLMDDNGELLPVLRLTTDPSPIPSEQLVAIVHVRGESVGLAVQTAGRVCDHYRLLDESTDIPAGLATPDAVCAHGSDGFFWLIDPDRLWQRQGGTADPLNPSD